MHVFKKIKEKKKIKGRDTFQVPAMTLKGIK